MVDYRLIWKNTGLVSFALMPQDWRGMTMSTKEFIDAATKGDLVQLVKERCHDRRNIPVYIQKRKFRHLEATIAIESKGSLPENDGKDLGTEEEGQRRMTEKKKGAWPNLIIDQRYDPFENFAHGSRLFRVQFLNQNAALSYNLSHNLTVLNIHPKSMANIDTTKVDGPLLRHGEKCSPIDTPNQLSITPSIDIYSLPAFQGYRYPKHIRVYEQCEGSTFHRLPDEFGWFPFDRSVPGECERAGLLLKAQALWGHLRNLQILSAPGCGPYVLLTTDTGLYLSRFDFSIVGLLSTTFYEAIEKLNLIDTLEEYLTQRVNEDMLENFYNYIAALHNPNGGMEFEFIDTCSDLALEEIDQEEVEEGDDDYDDNDYEEEEEEEEEDGEQEQEEQEQ